MFGARDRNELCSLVRPFTSPFKLGGYKNVVFVSTNPGWGGSEELWANAALNLASRGIPVAASIEGSTPLHGRVVELVNAGVDVQIRRYPHWMRVWRRMFARQRLPLEIAVTRFLASRPAAIVLISSAPQLPLGLLSDCARKAVPFATICQVNTECFWPDDEEANRYRQVLSHASRCYFVSVSNRRLFEKQIGCTLSNAEIVWNPFNVDINANPCWPSLTQDSDLRLACVARLHPPSKGQDILIEALSDPIWRDRRWRLDLYGEGSMRDGIERLIRREGLLDRIRFAGFRTSVEQIWAENHILVMPSRFEGMPLAMIEAMICGRPVLATDVAGHREIITDEVTGFIADAPNAESMARALERVWTRRFELEEMGKLASHTIRKRVPINPGGEFAEKILSLIV